jgi:hypothetical protein
MIFITSSDFCERYRPNIALCASMPLFSGALSASRLRPSMAMRRVDLGSSSRVHRRDNEMLLIALALSWGFQQ